MSLAAPNLRKSRRAFPQNSSLTAAVAAHAGLPAAHLNLQVEP